ncbi:UNVERIFIED_CONTAM: hypothetical protein FKN15_051398 [Acipenser sinensis]
MAEEVYEADSKRVTVPAADNRQGRGQTYRPETASMRTAQSLAALAVLLGQLHLLQVHSLRPADIAVVAGIRDWEPQVTFPGNVPTENSLPQQAQQLTDSLRNSMEIDFERDWKFITVFVDLEELCNFCDSEEKPSLEKAVKRVEGALEILYRQGALQQHLVDSGSYSDREDFTVVLHPTPDMSPQAGSVSDSTALDRMSRARRIALELWGSMLQPMRGQPDTKDSDDIIHIPCPTEDRPFLRTPRNTKRDSQAFTLQEISTAPSTATKETGSQLPCSDRQPSTSIPTSGSPVPEDSQEHQEGFASVYTAGDFHSALYSNKGRKNLPPSAHHSTREPDQSLTG